MDDGCLLLGLQAVGWGPIAACPAVRTCVHSPQLALQWCFPAQSIPAKDVLRVFSVLAGVETAQQHFSALSKTGNVSAPAAGTATAEVARVAGLEVAEC